MTDTSNTPNMPTAETYGALEEAYRFFNERLFGGRLMPCLFVMQRNKVSKRGHFHAEIWDSQRAEGYAADEMSINPNTLQSRSLTDLLSTLVHEMCHLEQHHFGEPSRNGYHNKEWGTMMERVGLMPSNTGEPGGKRTGQQMTHYIEPGGAFEEACAELIEGGFIIPWLSKDTTPPPKESKPSSKMKFTCPSCQQNAWGKPELRILCTDCNLPMLPKDVSTEQAAAMLAGFMDPKSLALFLGLDVPEDANADQIDLEAHIAAKENAA